MIRALAALSVLTFAVPALAQHPGLENTVEQCSDHVDNDGNGFVDCEDPKCRGIGQCRLPIIENVGDEKLTPRAQLAAGVIMLVLGPGVAAGSAAVYLDAVDQSNKSKRILEYTIGGVMTAAGLAIAIGGITLIRKGVLRHREDVEMGLALGPSKIGLHVTF